MNRSRYVSLIALMMTLVLFLGICADNPCRVFASESVGRVTMYYWAYYPNQIDFRYLNSGSSFYQDGGKWSFDVYDDEVEPHFYFPNASDIDIEFTTEDTDVLELEEYKDYGEFSNGIYVHIKQPGTALINIHIPQSDYYKENYFTLEINALHRDEVVYPKESPYIWYAYNNDYLSPNTVYTGSGTTYKNRDAAWNLIVYSSNHSSRFEFSENTEAVFSSENPEIMDVTNYSENGKSKAEVDVKKLGHARVRVDVRHSDYYEPCTLWINVSVEKIPQSIGENLSKTKYVDQTAKATKKAKTPVTYSSSNTTIATVSKDGIVKFIRPGTVTVTVRAAETDAYKGAIRKVKYKIKLRKPMTMKLSRPSKRAVKISWSKVSCADGYEVYVKYPGKSKYVKAVTRNATVKSVVHRGLTSKKTYRYKVRAFVKVKGKKYYLPFTGAKKIKVR